MNKFLTYSLALASLTFAAGCSENKPADQMEHTAQDHLTEAAMSSDSAAAANGMAAIYTCPMHPEVTSGKPGSCPKCKMDLVVKE